MINNEWGILVDLAECAYKDNSDGTVSDADNDLQWSIRDSRQELGKWLNWDEAEAYVNACNEQNYLGHNEFGLNHKSWNNPINYYDFNTIDYWLEQWFLFYKNIYEKYQSYENCHFIIYEELNISNYVETLVEKINLETMVVIIDQMAR